MEGTGYKMREKERVISHEHQAYLNEVRQGKIRILITRVAILLIFVVGWELMGRVGIIDPFITSQPSRIWQTLVNLYAEGVLFKHIGYTLFETILGFISGTLLGTLIAVFLWWSPFLSRVLDPYLVILNALPKIALGPILIVWIGNGPPAIITMGILVSLIVTIITVYTGFSQVDTDKIKLLQSFGATKWQILRLVILPASIPTIISALKINVGLAWVGVIVGEFLVSKAGLGYLIVYGGQVFRLDLVMASVIVLAILAAVMYQGVLYLEKKIARWQ